MMPHLSVEWTTCSRSYNSEIYMQSAAIDVGYRIGNQINK